MNVQKITEMRHQPKKAGSATLQFVPMKCGETPSRVEGLITIPFNERTEFIELQSGNQFMVIYPEKSAATYFGGQDELPFLTKLDGKSPRDLESEEEFYESLVPPLINLLQRHWILARKFGTGGNDRYHVHGDHFYSEYHLREASPRHGDQVLKRQGDFFAYPVITTYWGGGFTSNYITEALSWGEIMTFLRGIYDEVSSYSLYGTRHKLKGKMIRVPYLFLGGTDREEIVVIGSGEISAPDHVPLLLEEPHVILRSGMGKVREQSLRTTVARD